LLLHTNLVTKSREEIDQILLTLLCRSNFGAVITSKLPEYTRILGDVGVESGGEKESEWVNGLGVHSYLVASASANDYGRPGFK
jgi:hypothetical protein